MPRKLTNEEFIELSKTIHGDKYGYERCVYKTGREHVEIFCKFHNEYFSQAAERHYYAKQGCPKCGLLLIGDLKRKPVESFIQQSCKIHGNKYDYSNLVYKNSKSEIELFCDIHNNSFKILAASHLKGTGCPDCMLISRGLKGRSNTEEFVEKAILKHGDKYDYSLTDYVRSDLKVKIICKKHNSVFQSRPNRHLMGDGCVLCSNENTGDRCRKTSEKFINDAIEVHGKRYDYSITNYVRIKDKVEIICKEHGPFSIGPGAHLRGSGCQSCSLFGYRANIPGTIYVMSYGEITKVGITNKNVEIRESQICKSSGMKFETIYSKYFEVGNIPLNIETEILKDLKINHRQPDMKFSGYTECFYNVDQAKLINRIEELIKQQTLAVPDQCNIA